MGLGPQGGVTGRPSVFSWSKTGEVGLVEMRGENRRPRTAFRVLLRGGLRPSSLKLV